MKMFLIVVLIFISSGCFAQKLTEGASLLFKNVKTKLTITEKNEIYTSLNLKLTKNKKQFTDKADTRESNPYDEIDIFPTDLNKDGKEEIFVSMNSLAGNSGFALKVFIKNLSGKYNANILEGLLPQALTSSAEGYPDLMLSVPDMPSPIYHWNGTQYVLYKKISEVTAQKLKATNIDDISKAYCANIK